MGQKFSIHVKVGYFGTDQELMLTPAGLAIYFQDLAISHSNSLGYTLEWLAERKRGWAITNWHIQMIEYPGYGDELQISTWSNECRRMQAQRSFQVTDKTGRILCKAASRWIYMDLERRRPARLEEGMEKRYLCNLPSAIPDETYQIPKQKENIPLLKREFDVTRRDTDTNGHVNNIKYMEWAMDDVPDEVAEQFQAAEIRITYRKECYKGVRVLSQCAISDCSEGKEAITLFCNAENPQIIFAEVAILWVPRRHCSH